MYSAIHTLKEELKTLKIQLSYWENVSKVSQTLIKNYKLKITEHEKAIKMLSFMSSIIPKSKIHNEDSDLFVTNNLH